MEIDYRFRVTVRGVRKIEESYDATTYSREEWGGQSLINHDLPKILEEEAVNQFGRSSVTPITIELSIKKQDPMKAMIEDLHPLKRVIGNIGRYLHLKQ